MERHFILPVVCFASMLFTWCCGGSAPPPKNVGTAPAKNTTDSPVESKTRPEMTALRAACERIPNGCDSDFLERGVLLEISKSIREETIVAELTQTLRSCKFRTDCLTTAAIDDAEALIKLGFSILGEIGHVESVPASILLDRLGFYEASMAIDRILERKAEEEMSPGSCVPPTAADVIREKARLKDFIVFDWQKDRLSGRSLLPDEQQDAAYFFAAVLQNGREIKNLRTDFSKAPAACNLSAPKPMAGALRRLSEEARQATEAHNIPALVRAIRTFSEALFTMEVDVDFEPCLGDVNSWTSADFRDMAALSEALGLLDAADFLYRVPVPDSGSHVTSDDFNWETQVKGLIRVSERADRCNRVVAERLLSIDGPLEEWSLFDYGPDRLAKAGYDLPRIYRGAVLTRNREYLSAEPETTIENLQGSLLSSFRARFQKMGIEDWERRTFAAEGLIGTQKRPALIETIDLLSKLYPKSRSAVMIALGERAHRLTVGECKEDESMGVGSGGMLWWRKVRSVGVSCPDRLSDKEADELAEKLIPFLDDPEPEVCKSTVQALEQIASFQSIDALKEKAASVSTGGESLYLRDAANAAAAKIESLFQALKQ